MKHLTLLVLLLALVAPAANAHTATVFTGTQTAEVRDHTKKVVWSGRVTTGAKETPTPIGTFSVLGKYPEYRSGKFTNTRGEPTPMPFAVEFSEGYFIHEGLETPEGPSSHGCVRIGWHQGAAEVFNLLEKGDKVVIREEGQAAPVEATPEGERVAHFGTFGPWKVYRTEELCAVAARAGERYLLFVQKLDGTVIMSAGAAGWMVPAGAAKVEDVYLYNKVGKTIRGVRVTLSAVAKNTDHGRFEVSMPSGFIESLSHAVSIRVDGRDFELRPTFHKALGVMTGECLSVGEPTPGAVVSAESDDAPSSILTFGEHPKKFWWMIGLTTIVLIIWGVWPRRPT